MAFKLDMFSQFISEAVELFQRMLLKKILLIISVSRQLIIDESLTVNCFQGTSDRKSITRKRCDLSGDYVFRSKLFPLEKRILLQYESSYY